MNKPGDGANVQGLHPGTSFVRPAPVPLIGMGGRDPLPQDGIAQRLDAQTSEQVEVFQPLLVPRTHSLIHELVAHPVHRALVAAPKLDL